MNIDKLVYKIQSSVSCIENLNSGGCGVFAAMVAKRLNRIGIPAVVRIGDLNAYFNPNALSSTLENYSFISKEMLSKNGVGFDHLIVEFTYDGKTYHMDSSCFHEAKTRTTLFDRCIYNGYLTPYQALLVAKCRTGWNWCFNRKQIPLMIKQLNNAFS